MALNERGGKNKNVTTYSVLEWTNGQILTHCDLIGSYFLIDL